MRGARTSRGRWEAVVFDLDGTLVDSMDAFLAVYVETVRRLGGPDLAPADIVAAFHVGATADVLSHFLGRPAADADVERFYELASEAAPGVHVFAGVAEMLTALRLAGVRLGVFTGATGRTARLLLEAGDLGASFPVVVGGDEVGQPKPCPDGLLAVCQRLGVAVSEAAFVGDSQLDVDCARAAGCHAVLASWGARSPVTGFDAVAEAPSDLLALAGLPPPTPEP